MSAESAPNYPTFVNINTSHMSSVEASNEQDGMSHDQGNIEEHQPQVISDHQQENGIATAIPAFHDQAAGDINTDSDSHQNSVQDQLTNLSSPGGQDVIYVGDTGINTDDFTHVWQKEEVELMFKYYKEKHKYFNDSHKKKRELFLYISAELKKHGYNPTPKQCDRKLRNMKATYIRTLERIKRGDTMATCQYYDDLYDIYGLNPPLQTPSRLQGQNRNRPVPVLKADFVNGQGSNEIGIAKDSFEPVLKKFGLEMQEQRDLPVQKSEQQPDGPAVAFNANSLQLFDERLDALRKNINELTEELKVTKNNLNAEREGREEDRKAFAEERREFHKERMSMLNTIHKLIGTMDQKTC